MTPWNKGKGEERVKERMAAGTLECVTCKQTLGIEEFSPGTLKSTVPVCRSCRKTAQDARRNRYLEANRKAGVVTCASCMKKLPLGEFSNSELRKGTSYCRECRSVIRRQTERLRKAKREREVRADGKPCWYDRYRVYEDPKELLSRPLEQLVDPSVLDLAELAAILDCGVETAQKYFRDECAAEERADAERKIHAWLAAQ